VIRVLPKETLFSLAFAPHHVLLSTTGYIRPILPAGHDFAPD
jgi:hypothetical protein